MLINKQVTKHGKHQQPDEYNEICFCVVVVVCGLMERCVEMISKKNKKFGPKETRFFLVFQCPVSGCRLSIVRSFASTRTRTLAHTAIDDEIIKKTNQNLFLQRKKNVAERERDSRDTDWMKKSSRNNKRTTALSSVSFFFAVFQQKKRESTNNKKRIKDVEMRTKNNDRRCGWFFWVFLSTCNVLFFCFFFLLPFPSPFFFRQSIDHGLQGLGCR